MLLQTGCYVQPSLLSTMVNGLTTWLKAVHYQIVTAFAVCLTILFKWCPLLQQIPEIKLRTKEKKLISSYLECLVSGTSRLLFSLSLACWLNLFLTYASSPCLTCVLSIYFFSLKYCHVSLSEVASSINVFSFCLWIFS